MRYCQNRRANGSRCLQQIGAGSIDDLFSTIPTELPSGTGPWQFPRQMAGVGNRRILRNAASKKRGRLHQFSWGRRRLSPLPPGWVIDSLVQAG